MNIRTSNIRPPIGTTQFDWSAVLDDYDGAPDAGWQPVGYGATEAQAIANLQAEIEMHEEDAEQERQDNGQFGVGA